ncbi:hypothetical protein E2C01_001434 [Portunus trituberculatus]|uniref:Uncharacterized protein n=1 Tax=Portunus trituberculatus TaxID=210409 RepID=A0A5B7CJA2_PORTR|nr:hypothetical protein [Portunus trituberculatus]
MAQRQSRGIGLDVCRCHAAAVVTSDYRCTNVCPIVGGGIAFLGSVVLISLLPRCHKQTPAIYSPHNITKVFEVSPEAVSTRGSLAGHSGEARVGAAPGTLSYGLTNLTTRQVSSGRSPRLVELPATRLQVQISAGKLVYPAGGAEESFTRGTEAGLRPRPSRPAIQT